MEDVILDAIRNGYGASPYLEARGSSSGHAKRSFKEWLLVPMNCIHTVGRAPSRIQVEGGSTWNCGSLARYPVVNFETSEKAGDVLFVRNTTPGMKRFSQ